MFFFVIHSYFFLRLFYVFGYELNNAMDVCVESKTFIIIRVVDSWRKLKKKKLKASKKK